MRPAWLEIDLAALRANVALFRQRIQSQCRICAVVKGNAYGHGAVEVAKAALAAGATDLAVAIASEAEELRDAGIDSSILILGESAPEQADQILRCRATPAVATPEMARALDAAAASAGVPACIHIKIDSGMGRQGVRWDEVQRLAGMVSELPHLRVTGIFTHFAVAESDLEFTRWQYNNFLQAAQQAEAILGPIADKHCCNTAAAALYPDMHHEMIRPGAGLYGLNPGIPPEALAGVQRVLQLRARIALVKTLHRGDSVGYGRAWRAPATRRIALLPLGYCDGYPRVLSNNADVLIRGRRVPVVGRISMDCTMVDVTELGDVQVGEEAVLIGKQGTEQITVEEVAGRADTIVQDIVSRLSPRLPRIYINRNDTA